MATAQAAVRRPVAAVTSRPVLAAGLGCLLLVALGVVSAYPDASPLSPDHSGDDRRWAWLYLGGSVAAFGFYLGGLVLLSRGRGRLRLVLALACAIQLVPLAGPVLLSTDVYTYWARGRVAPVHGGNPYSDAPSRYPGDPAYSRMGADWRDRPTGYGPAFTLVSEGHAVVAGGSPVAAALLYKAIAAASMLILVSLAAGLAHDRAFAAAFVGWNPLLALHFAGGGHNDALVAAFVLAAIALAARGRPQLAGAAWASAIALKWFPLVLLPLRALEAWRTGRPVRHLGFAAAAALIAGLAFWRYGTEWLAGSLNFSRQLGRTTSMSPSDRLADLGVSEGVAIAGLASVFALAYLWLLREAWRGRARLGLCACLLLLTTSWLVPWYAVWAVPLAAVEEDRAARLLALALSAYLLRGAVPL